VATAADHGRRAAIRAAREEPKDALVQRLAQSLPPDERHALLQRELHARSIEAIGQEMGLSPRAVQALAASAVPLQGGLRADRGGSPGRRS